MLESTKATLRYCLLLSSAFTMFCSWAFCSWAAADEWPQWMGPNRDGVYAETGIVDSIPDQGLPVLWRAPVSLGYSGPAVSGGRVFLTDYAKSSGTSTNNPGGRDQLTGKERVLCFDAKSGDQLWAYEYERPYELSYPNGPRATPTVDGEYVYALGAEGDLNCLRCSDGQLVWHRQLQDEYKAEAPIWGYSAHPLVHGDLLYTLAGGEGSAVVALDKRTGKEVWRALNTADIGYCPPTIRKLGGREHLVIWHSESMHGLDPANGKEFWSFPLAPRYGMAIAAPQLDGNRLFATGIGETSAMIEFDDQGMPGNSIWNGKPKIGIYSGNATALFSSNAIYGSDCGSGMFIAVNPHNGERYWQTYALTTGGERRASHGTTFVVQHDDKHILFTETGDLVFARLTPETFTELGRMQVLEPTGECFGRSVVWSHPAFANRCCFARNDKELVCVSLAAE